MVQHAAIPDAQLHEPKGVAAASANTSYIANGVGSGTWKALDSLALSGLSGDGGSSNKRLVSNGANGFVFKENAAYGSMAVNNNTNNFALTAVADTTFNTGSQYSLYTGTGAPLAAVDQFGVTFSTDRLTVLTAGVYEFSLWANVNSFPSVTAKAAFRYRINGSTYSTRFPVVKSGASGDICNVGFSEIITLSANDYIQIVTASDVTGNLVIQNLYAKVNLIKAS